MWVKIEISGKMCRKDLERINKALGADFEPAKDSTIKGKTAERFKVLVSMIDLDWKDIRDLLETP